MPSPRTPCASPPHSNATKPGRRKAPRTADRAQNLIETMLEEMQKGLHDPAYCATEEWDRLFGSKQSMVANLQKLVATLASLSSPSARAAEAEDEVIQISAEDMELLKAWIEQEQQTPESS